MKSYQFHPEALKEADEAALFYQKQQPGLETRFLEALEDAISRVRRNPLFYHRIDGEIRKCRLLRFPYGVVYRIKGDNVEIIAIMHFRRQPGYWKLRL